jgi:hypothetical protein
MKKSLNLIAILLFLSLSLSSHSQAVISKLVGKNSGKTKTGYGLFAFYDFPLTEEGNRSIRLELLDVAFFPKKDGDLNAILAYVSIKVGYKYIFSESKTGFFLEPQVGYCRTVLDDANQVDPVVGNGVAAALEGGYSLEVGQKGNTINAGLKYEKDMAGKLTSISSISLRLSYSFGLFKRRG